MIPLHRTRPTAVALAGAACLALAAPIGAQAAAKPTPVPSGFVGIHMDNLAELDAAGVDIAAELKQAKSKGAETFRVAIYWSNVQPYATWAAVPEARRSGDCVPDPADGAPWCLGTVSKMVTASVNNGIKLVPILQNAPTWVPSLPTGGADGLEKRVPRDFDHFASFARGLAQRFGAGGSMLPAGKASPIAAWQIWNEPNFHQYWPQHAGKTQTITRTVRKKIGGKMKTVTETVSLPDLYFAPTYLDLVRKSRSAIRSVDPKAKIMLASIANGDFSVRPDRAPRSVDLDYIYKSGGKDLFDIAAANIFTGTIDQIYARLGDYRAVMASNGDSAKPIAITEFAWADRQGLPIDDSTVICGQLSLVLPVSPNICSPGGLVPRPQCKPKVASRVKFECPPASQSEAITSAFELLSKYRVQANLWGLYWHTWASEYTVSLSDSGKLDLWRLTGLKQVTGATTVAKPSLKAFCTAAKIARGSSASSAARACKS